MNRLRINYRLLQDPNRLVYTITSYVQSKNLYNIADSRTHENTCLLSKFTLSSKVDRKQKLSIISHYRNNSLNNFENSRKIGGYLLSQGHRNFQKNENYRKNIRKFSESKTEIPKYLELEGFWKAVTECAAVEFCQNTLVTLHSTTGLPWWATIIITTWTLRLFVTLPLALYQNYILAKVENLKYEMMDIVQQLKEETNISVHKYKWTESYTKIIYNRTLKERYQKLLERDNCHPMKAIVVVVIQLPMWIIMSTSLRNLCYILPYNNEHARAIYLELTTGGFGWITNLAVVDSSLLLPISLGILNLTIIEMQALMRPREASKIQRYMTNFFRLMSIGMIPLAAYVPAGMSLYWASSSAFGIVQNLLIASPRIRRLVGIPPTDSELEEPYKHLYHNLEKKIGIRNISLPNNAKKL